ncbi:MAG TPA: hypothetical protein VLV31_01265 [Candidatus Acidoferrales bacterium]|nr:hypothetical protein [Candidatus Acidoferrales bacterium]
MASTKNATSEITQISINKALIVLPGLVGAKEDRSFRPRYTKSAAITSINAANRIESVPVYGVQVPAILLLSTQQTTIPFTVDVLGHGNYGISTLRGFSIRTHDPTSAYDILD